MCLIRTVSNCALIRNMRYLNCYFNLDINAQIKVFFQKKLEPILIFFLLNQVLEKYVDKHVKKFAAV